MNQLVADNTIQNNDAWVNFQSLLRKEFGDDIYNVWLFKIQLFKITGSELILSVPTDFVKIYITRDYFNGAQRSINGKKVWVKKGVKQLAFEAYPEIKSVELIVDKSRSEELKLDDGEIKATTKDTTKDVKKVVSISEHDNLYNIGTELDPSFTFDNFVVGLSNKLAYSVCKSIVDNTEMNFETNPLFLYGNVGLGKTHLCQAIAWGLKEKYPNKNIVYLTAEKFMYLFVQSLQNQDVNSFKDRFRNVDVLIIDDIHFIAGKDSTQKEFFQTFNVLISENKQIILACDRSPLRLEKVDEQLKSRMNGGLVVDVFDTDYQLRYDLVKFKSKQFKLELSDDLVKYIAETVVTNCREIEACLKRLSIQQKFMQVKITKSMIEEILADSIAKAKKTVTIENIQEKVSKFFNVSLSDLKSDKRLKDLVIPRHIAMYFSKKYTQKSFPDIAKKFGGKNHATVIHAVNKVEELMKEDVEINDIVVKLTNIINT